LATLLKDTLHTKTPSELYDLVESGWNVSYARVELARRGLPLTRPKKPKKRSNSAPRFHAKRRVKVTSGFVDVPTYARIPREHLPGAPIEPWNR